MDDPTTPNVSFEILTDRACEDCGKEDGIMQVEITFRCPIETPTFILCSGCVMEMQQDEETEQDKDTSAETAKNTHGQGQPTKKKTLKNLLLTARSRVTHDAEQEFASVRSWYHSMSSQDRQKFKSDIQQLFEVSDRVAQNWSISVKAKLGLDQSDEHGNCIFSAGANQTPKEWLEAITLWDETRDSEQE